MNKITIFSLTLLFALILPLFANAQVTVKGIVTDESGVPLVGVSVRYKELPQVGVTTDIDGKFSIKEMKEVVITPSSSPTSLTSTLPGATVVTSQVMRRVWNCSTAVCRS